nr:TonB-dependent receptor [uncultured Sphingomonas sp.]
MTIHTNSSRFWLAASPLALCAALIASPAAAQTTAQPVDEPTSANPSETATTDAAAVDDTIVVTGFRRALENAINKKKNSEQIVESVSAEDIGKLPDASIGESIARLPGLTSQRLNGRSAFIAIRGFGPDFSTTLLNGREQTSTNDNRGVEFDQYPSEVVSRVDVYKTFTPNIIGQGLVGTVDIRTTRPLDSKRQVIAVGLKGSKVGLGKLNSGSKEYGWRANATYVDQFADDRMGIAISASYVDEPYQVQEYNAWGWGTNGPGGTRLIDGNKSFVTSTQLKRAGVTATFQADVTDTIRLTADGFYSHFEDDIIKRGIELPLGGAFGWTSAAVSGTTITDGVVTSGTFTDIEAVVNNHALQREADLYSGGLNLEWRPGNGWKGSLDISHSRTDRNELNLETNSGTGRGQGVGARDTIQFNCGTTGCTFKPTLNYSDPNLIQLTSPMGWGGGVPGVTAGQDGYYNDRILEDRLTQYRGDIEKEIGSFVSSVRAGIAYTDRSRDFTPDEYFLVLANGAAQQRVPDQYLLKPTQLDYLGLGPVISYDPVALLGAGFYNRVANPNSDVARKAYEISEKVTTAYLMANIDQELGLGKLTGNIGAQAVRTDQSSTGAATVGTTFTRQTRGDKYWDILPSANLSLRTDGDFVVRFAAARQMQRPRIDDMRNSFDYGFSATNQRIEGGGGNPLLRPYRANAVDLTFEKYFGIRGYLALQLFHKDLKNYIDRRTVAFDYTGLPLAEAPGGIIPPGVAGVTTQPINVGDGSIKGYEIAGTLPFGEFVGALDGFGITGGYGYTKSRVRAGQDGELTPIPGYSKHVANGTLFFEKWGFSARGSLRYRSTYLGDVVGLGGDIQRRQAKSETIVDAQVGYDFQSGSRLEGVSLFLQGQNLTNEPFVTIVPGEPLRVVDYQRYGRRYQAGITFKF